MVSLSAVRACPSFFFPGSTKMSRYFFLRSRNSLFVLVRQIEQERQGEAKAEEPSDPLFHLAQDPGQESEVHGARFPRLVVPVEKTREKLAHHGPAIWSLICLKEDRKAGCPGNIPNKGSMLAEIVTKGREVFSPR